MVNFQREGSISNAHAGRDFENAAQHYFAEQGIHLQKQVSLQLGVSHRSKPHVFDLGDTSQDEKVVVECKSHKWTSGGNVPSAKMTVWNEAMYYFLLVPGDYRKILFILKDYSERREETLGEYYIRTYGHLIPDGVEFAEYDNESGDVRWLDVSSEPKEMRELSCHVNYQPFEVKEGDEIFRNGFFHFNISRILEDICAGTLVPMDGKMDVEEWAREHPRTQVEEAYVEKGNVSVPVIQAEISPGMYVLIDGNHRMEKAVRTGVSYMDAYILRGEQLVPYFTEVKRYEAFVEYWNTKVEQLERDGRARAGF